MKEWTYHLRCLACKKEYEETPISIDLGPVHDDIVIGVDETEIGISTYKTEKLYGGRITDVCCPYCLLRISITIDLLPSSWVNWLRWQKVDFQNIPIEQLFENNRVFRGFPLDCPRCSRAINKEKEGKRCKFCDSEQLNLITSNARLD